MATPFLSALRRHRDLLLALMVVALWSAWGLSEAPISARQVKTTAVDVSTNSTADLACSGHGVSQFGKCFCQPGWTGTTCDQATELTCGGHGIEYQGKCFCEPGWAGATCDQLLEATCEHGIAFNGKCFCEQGWKGARCDESIGPPACINGVAVAGKCFCEQGWKGATCEEQIETPLMCDHGLERFGRCFCEPGWSGETCDQATAPVIPRLECIGQDPGNPAFAIARFGYLSLNTSPTLVRGPNAMLVNGLATSVIGAPDEFLPGLHTNAFSVRFNPATEAIEWTLFGNSVSPSNVTPACETQPGPKGDRGDRGKDGLDGLNGIDGRDGTNGKDGRDGRDGVSGNIGPRGLTGLTGPVGPGLRFVTIPINVSGNLVMPSDAASPPSAIFMVTVPPARRRGDAERVDLTLPVAGNASSRLVTVRRLDDRGRVFIHARPADHIEGWREVPARADRDTDVLALDTRWDYVTLVSDGVTWFVLAQGQ